MKAKWGITIPLITMLLFIFQGIVLAGTTGKIAGRITDAETGEPLIGANVIITGTSLGAARRPAEPRARDHLDLSQQ